MSNNPPLILNKYVTTPQKIFIYLVLAIFFAYLCLYAFEASEPNRFNSWLVGDWLINYGGGFIRRGMGGYLIINLASLLKISPELVVAFLKSSCYTIIYLGLIYLVSKKKLTVLDFLILLSPLTYSFPILDPAGGGRKEIILLAGMTILALGSTLNFKIPRISILSLLLFTLTLIHEGLLFFYPLALLLIPAMFGVRRYLLKELTILLLPSIGLMIYFSLGSSGISEHKLLAIAKEIDPVNFEAWNKGAIEALSWTMGDSIQLVKKHLMSTSIVSFSIAIMAVGLMFYVVGAWKSLCQQLRISPAYLVAIFMIQLPLLIVTIDWGRWIYIDASLLAIYYLCSRVDLIIKDRPLALQLNANQNTGLSVMGFLGFIALLAISITLWKVNHCCTQGVSWGVLTKPLFKLL